MPDELTANSSNKPEFKSGRMKRPTNAGDLSQLLDRTETKLHRTEMLLSVTQKIAGLSNLSEILWTLIEMTTTELVADRGSLFLNDPLTGELYSRVAQGELTREIRILNTTGIAGAVFQNGEGEKPFDYTGGRRNRLFSIGFSMIFKGGQTSGSRTLSLDY